MPSGTPKKLSSAPRKSERLAACSNVTVAECTRLGVTPRATRVSKKRTSAVPNASSEENDSSPPKQCNLSVAGLLPSRALLSSTFCEPIDPAPGHRAASRTGTGTCRTKPVPLGEHSVSHALASLQLESPPRRLPARSLRFESTTIEEEPVHSLNHSDAIRHALSRRLFAEPVIDERALMADPVSR